MILRRKPERFRRWTHRYRAGRNWPLPGFVAVVGSEAQDAVFLDLSLVERLGDSAAQLRVTGNQTWQVDRGTLLDELQILATMGGLSEEQLATVSQAIELVEYEIGNESGVAVVPPTSTILGPR